MTKHTHTPTRRLIQIALVTFALITASTRVAAEGATESAFGLPTEINGTFVGEYVTLAFAIVAIAYYLASRRGMIESSKHDRRVVVGMLAVGAFFAPAVTVETAYLMVLVAVYGVWAYRETYTEFVVGYSYTHVAEEMEVHRKCKAVADRWALLLIGLLVVAVWNPLGISNAAQVFGGAMAVASYLSARRQQPHIEAAYKHLRQSTNTRTWMLPAKVMVVFSAGVVLLHPSLFWPAFLGFFAPYAAYLAFKGYFRRTDDSKIGFHKVWKEHRSRSKVAYAKEEITAVEEVDLDYEVSEPPEDGKDHEAAGKIELSLTIEVPRPLGTTYLPWASFLLVATHLKGVLASLATVDQEREEEFQEFYEDAVRIGVEQLEETKPGVQLDDYPTRLVQEIHAQRAKAGMVTMEEIVDDERGRKEDPPSEPERYADVQRWD